MKYCSLRKKENGALAALERRCSTSRCDTPRYGGHLPAHATAFNQTPPPDGTETAPRISALVKMDNNLPEYL